MLTAEPLYNTRTNDKKQAPQQALLQAPQRASQQTQLHKARPLDELIDILIDCYAEKLPPKNTLVNTNLNVAEVAWQLLNQIDANPGCLTSCQIERLDSRVAWFRHFYKCAVIRSCYGESNANFANTVFFLSDRFPDKPPSNRLELCFLIDPEGRSVVFEPLRALEHMGERWNDDNGPKLEVKKGFIKLPWAKEWLVSNLGPSHSGTVRSKSLLITTPTKLAIISMFYPHEPPKSNDMHAIRISRSSVATFKPTQFLDNIVNCWLGGECHVRLTKEDKDAMEKLPWFESWIEERRKYRKHSFEKQTGSKVNTHRARSTKRKRTVDGDSKHAKTKQEMCIGIRDDKDEAFLENEVVDSSKQPVESQEL